MGGRFPLRGKFAPPLSRPLLLGTRPSVGVPRRLSPERHRWDGGRHHPGRGGFPWCMKAAGRRAQSVLLLWISALLGRIPEVIGLYAPGIMCQFDQTTFTTLASHKRLRELNPHTSRHPSRQHHCLSALPKRKGRRRFAADSVFVLRIDRIGSWKPTVREQKPIRLCPSHSSHCRTWSFCSLGWSSSQHIGNCPHPILGFKNCATMPPTLSSISSHRGALGIRSDVLNGRTTLRHKRHILTFGEYLCLQAAFSDSYSDRESTHPPLPFLSLCESQVLTTSPRITIPIPSSDSNLWFSASTPPPAPVTITQVGGTGATDCTLLNFFVRGALLGPQARPSPSRTRRIPDPHPPSRDLWHHFAGGDLLKLEVKGLNFGCAGCPIISMAAPAPPPPFGEQNETLF